MTRVRPIAQARGRLVNKGKSSYDVARAVLKLLNPITVTERRRSAEKRRDAEQAMQAFVEAHVASNPTKTLIDGMFDNPNFWLRVTLARIALGTHGGREVGVVGPYQSTNVRNTFARFGMEQTVEFDGIRPSLPRSEIRRQVEDLLSSARTPDDVLNWQLPFGYPTLFLYDGVLKSQRKACFDLDDPLVADLIEAELTSLYRADSLLDQQAPDHVLLSHNYGTRYGALAWLAITKGIPATVLFGLYGVPRLHRLRRHEDVFRVFPMPTVGEIEALPPASFNQLSARGTDYLASRLGGKQSDLGSTYAFARARNDMDRTAICEHFSWDPQVPIVAVYASNWYDYPHHCGMANFRDFLDWIECTWEVAGRIKTYNWLFRPHPCDEWYGGVTLRDLFAEREAPANIGVCPLGWNGATVMHSVDGLITVTGTSGIEFAAHDIPVLLADRAWYEESDIAEQTRTRYDYVAMLESGSWLRGATEARRERARVAAGWYFSNPDWQQGFELRDDSAGQVLYDDILALLSEQPAALKFEVDCLTAWFASDERFYHSFKMKSAFGQRD